MGSNTIMKKSVAILLSFFMLFTISMQAVASIQAPPNMPPVIEPPSFDVPPIITPPAITPPTPPIITPPLIDPPSDVVDAVPPTRPPQAKKPSLGWKVVVKARCSGLEPILRKPFFTAVDGETACYSTKEEAQLAAENTLIPFLSRKCREELERTGITENFIFTISYESVQRCDLPQESTTQQSAATQ